MQIMPWLQKNKILLAALLAGLIIGAGIGFLKLNKAERIFQDKLREAHKRITYLNDQVTNEKTGAAVFEQKCQGDLDKLTQEKSAIAGQLRKEKERAKTLEANLKSSDEAVVAGKKELREMAQKKNDLDHELKKTMGEKQTLQAELKKTTRELGQCSTNNAKLCVLSDELVKKYKNKGLGSLLLEKEPITQVKKVELEHLTQQYREEIEQLKIKNKDAEEKNGTE